MGIKNYLDSFSFNLKDSSTLWVEADQAFVQEKPEHAYSIYRHLARRKPKTSLNFLHVALSAYRLKNCEVAIEILESGMNIYPDSSELCEQHFRICAEAGQIDRAIKITGKYGGDPISVCEHLFRADSAGIADAIIRISLVDYCIKHGLHALSERAIRFITGTYPDTIIHWRLADVLLANKKTSDANSIYRDLASRRTEGEFDFLYAGLSELRLDRIDAGLTILENGLRRYQNSKDLSEMYLATCASYLRYERYIAFIESINIGDINGVKDKFDFYRMAIENGSVQQFMIAFNELEDQFDEREFVKLKDFVLSHLIKHPISLVDARGISFFCDYMDIEAIFKNRVHEIICAQYRSKKDADDVILLGLRLLQTLTPPIVLGHRNSAEEAIEEFVQSCKSIESEVFEMTDPIGDMTVNWAPWQYIFCLAKPEAYPRAMAVFEETARKAWPRLAHVAKHVGEGVKPISKLHRKLRIGFAVHDSMPMMSGFLDHLDKQIFETVFLRPGEQGSSQAAKNWVMRADKVVEYSDINVSEAIDKIAAEELDIIISGPSVPAVFFPMMSRLATLQMVLLEPLWTNGLANTDYYISWQPAEPSSPRDFYDTSVAYLRNPPYWIERPSFQSEYRTEGDERTEIRARILGVHDDSHVYLCANTPPKIHPDMDDIFDELLTRDSTAKLVLLRAEYPPAKNIKLRLKRKLGEKFNRVIFLPTLPRDDAHALVQAVDCCIDSYPLCGMSSSFDGAMLGVPIVTLPAEIPFGRWTASIFEYIGVSELTAKNKANYVEIAIRLASDPDWRLKKSREIREKSARYVENRESSNEFQSFIMDAWNRAAEGLPPADFVAGRWD